MPATGWLLDGLGAETPLATAADGLGPASPWLAGLLWLAAAVAVVRGRSGSGAVLAGPARRGTPLVSSDR